MAYDKRKMQDMTYTEYKNGLLEQYKTLWENADFDGINTLFENNPDLKYKIFDAFNWNRMINLINDQTYATTWDETKTYNIYDMVRYDYFVWVSKIDNNRNEPTDSQIYWQKLYSDSDTHSATENSLVGKWQNDINSLWSIVYGFHYSGAWNEGENYSLGNLVITDSQNSYFCIQAHTSSASNKPPNVTYWMPAQTMLDSVGLKVLENAPTNYSVGDMYLQVID